MRWLSPADDTVRATCPVRLSPLQMCAICSHWAFIHYLSYLHFYGGQLQYLFIYLFFPQIFWLLWVVFSGKRKGEVEKKWNKKIKKRIWTETTALNERNTFEVCLLICSLLHWNLASKRLEIMRPRGELNGTSQPIFFLSPREKRASIPPFVVQTHLPFLFQSFPPFSPFTCLILLSVSFTSPRHSLRLATKLISPLLSLKAPPISSCPYSSPSFFFIEGPQSCFTSPSSVIPPHTSALHSILEIGVPSSWSHRPPPPPLCSPCPLRSLCGPSFSGSVWCVSLWSFCATVHPVDRKHPVHHHSQLPVGSAGSVWPICVIFCQITGVWLRVIRPSPNRLPGERGREAGERKVQAGQASSASSARPEGAPRRSSRLSRDTIHCSCMTKDAGALCLLKDV